VQGTRALGAITLVKCQFFLKFWGHKPTPSVDHGEIWQGGATCQISPWSVQREPKNQPTSKNNTGRLRFVPPAGKEQQNWYSNIQCCSQFFFKLDTWIGILCHCDINCQSEFVHITHKSNTNVGYVVSWSLEWVSWSWSWGILETQCLGLGTWCLVIITG